MSILIKNVLFGNTHRDILISGNKISRIALDIDEAAEKIIDGTDKAIVPGFFNAHTHAAMTLMRGYADDMKLMDWLENEIWPLEAVLTPKDVYWGTRLAVLEMIKSGTTFFTDMYYQFDQVAKATDEMGIRAMAGSVIFDMFNDEMKKAVPGKIERDFEISQKYDNIHFSLAPHAIYTVSGETLKYVKEFSDANDVPIHIHLSETEFEVSECKRNNSGMTPVEYLNSLGILSEKVIAAHCLHLTDNDIKILADTGVKIAHNPISNMKLASGNDFRYPDLKKAGVPVAFGTDGTSSNNNLDMLETAKIAALNQKDKSGDPTVLPADDAMAMLSETCEEFTGLKTGKIEEGYLADFNLVNLRRHDMIPNHNYISNLIYSANGSAVDTVICDGKIVMENCIVPGEDEIFDTVPKIVQELIKRKNEKQR
jgi:5-methylthioadenosine/S-adenosylhomocysteine deaminase